MTTITLTNDFHNTSTRVRLGRLSKSTVQRVRRTLCGAHDCTCAQSALGTRGSQRQDDGRRIGIDSQPDGSADVWIDE